MNNQNNIYIDTNILIGCYNNNEPDVLAVNYLYSLKGKRLYVSSLSIAQLASVFQKIKTSTEIKDIIKEILTKVNIVQFTENDITAALEYENKDIEDNIQYVLSQKVKCLWFVTNNIKDYRAYSTICALKSTDVRSIDK
ncbi:MAG: type II toxin-antitoxin system VapC family toxin [Paludibacteraceae bacterium]|nr:type II toxin-antitoxin system VapC family toxin [Paludibacteraceae bacterium]